MRQIRYGAYIFHFVLVSLSGGVLVRLPIGDKLIPTAAVGLAGTLILAWLSFHYFESPLIRMKARWTSSA